MAPALILVHPSVTYRNVADLIADMRASKEPFQVGTPGVSTVNHLSALLFAQQAGVKLQYIPYKGSRAAQHRSDRRLRQGRLQPDPGVARRHRRQADPRAGGDIAEARSRVPRPADRRGIRPARLRRGADLRHRRAGRHAAARSSTSSTRCCATRLPPTRSKRRLAQEGAEPMPTTPEEHAAVLDREDTKWSAIIKSAGIQEK